ncbi:hypothetical protein AB0M42_32265, partial [Streptomyces sp. NPDC051784]
AYAWSVFKPPLESALDLSGTASALPFQLGIVTRGPALYVRPGCPCRWAGPPAAGRTGRRSGADVSLRTAAGTSRRS